MSVALNILSAAAAVACFVAAWRAAGVRRVDLALLCAAFGALNIAALAARAGWLS